MMGLLGLSMLQEVAASVPVDGLTIQAAAVMLIPVLIQMLKKAIPTFEGSKLFYANMVLNLLTAVGVMMGAGVGAAEALSFGIGGSLATSKLVDISKRRSVEISDRHRK